MVSKRKNNNVIKRKKLIASAEIYENLRDQLADSLSLEIHTVMDSDGLLRSPTTSSSCKLYIDTLFSILLDPYVNRKFSMCRPIKRAVENWMHESSDMSLQDIGAFTGPLVESNKQYDLYSSTHPWFPGHGLGYHMWSGVFILMGALTESSNNPSNLLEGLRPKDGYKNTITKILEADMPISNAFKIEPGQELIVTGLI